MSKKTKLHPEDFLEVRCTNDEKLDRWVREYAGIQVPRRAVCKHHHAPFEYIRRAYFEPANDLVVWAPRGGGKTRLAAVATLLDLLHKPGCAVRIIGGSLEQSLRMWEHLRPNMEEIAPHILVPKKSSSRKITLASGSSAAVLTQSERAVRGLRVQKLRCDEVEMFQPQIWEAAQLVTRSTPEVHGSIEAISTFHSVHGLMHKIIERAEARRTPVIRWCLLEVLEKCPPERECRSCPLYEECRGVAKHACEGFVKIDDAIAMKHRVSRETWDAEVMCNRPSVRGSVFPSFSVQVHVKEAHGLPSVGFLPEQMSLAIDFGFHSPFVCLWIHDDGEVCHVIDEYVQEQRTISEHVEQIESRPWGKLKRISCDPSGAGRNDQTSESNVNFLRRHKYKVLTRHSLIVEGLELIRAGLHPAAGQPRLFIHPRCKRLIRAMQQYRYPSGGGELPLKDGEHDHPIDALRYFYVNRGVTGKLQTRGY